MAKVNIIIGRREGQYSIPANIIAENRTVYYARNDGFERGGEEWADEYDFVINDDYLLEDWMFNNMDWSDIKPHATKLPTKPTIDSGQWDDTEIIKVER